VVDEWPGYCSICEIGVIFRAQGTWHRDELVCTSCGSIPRQRALVAVLAIVAPDWRRARLWELAPAGPASEKLRLGCAAYVASHYWPDIPPGTVVDGVRSEDVERPTFADASFDIVVSSDVFEHIIDVDTAMAQIARVLDYGGLHVWTAPQYRDIETSRPRVRRTASGLDYLVPPEYHGDPVNPEGVLVTYDWGRDLADRVESASGLWTTGFRVESRTNGLLGEFLEVFVSHKGPAGALAVATQTQANDQSKRVAELEAQLQRANASRDAAWQTISSIESSNSWRLTQPLRAVAARVRRR
jgi:hypothetical protein